MKCRLFFRFTRSIILICAFFTKNIEAGESFKLVQKIEEISGEVLIYNESNHSVSQAFVGMLIEKPTLFHTGKGAEMIFSCTGKISARISEYSVALLSPVTIGRYEVELKRGTITVSLDPNRPQGSPLFAVRTFAGVTEAKGTLFAVTEYNGQSYTAVKNGSIKKKTLPPTKPDFSAYLSGAKSKIAKPISGKTNKKE